MLLPKRVKYRREHRGKMRGRAKGGTEVHFGKGTTLYFPEKRAVTEGHAAWIKIADLEKFAINYAHKMALNHLLKL